MMGQTTSLKVDKETLETFTVMKPISRGTHDETLRAMCSVVDREELAMAIVEQGGDLEGGI